MLTNKHTSPLVCIYGLPGTLIPKSLLLHAKGYSTSPCGEQCNASFTQEKTGPRLSLTSPIRRPVCLFLLLLTLGPLVVIPRCMLCVAAALTWAPTHIVRCNNNTWKAAPSWQLQKNLYSILTDGCLLVKFSDCCTPLVRSQSATA